MMIIFFSLLCGNVDSFFFFSVPTCLGNVDSEVYKFIQISETFGSSSLYSFRYVSVLDLKCLQEQGRNHLCFS